MINSKYLFNTNFCLMACDFYFNGEEMKNPISLTQNRVSLTGLIYY